MGLLLSRVTEVVQCLHQKKYYLAQMYAEVVYKHWAVQSHK